MLSENEKHLNRHKLYGLNDCILDFKLSHQAILCTPSTIRFYRLSLGKFIEFLDSKGVMKPTQITAEHIRAYLSEYGERFMRTIKEEEVDLSEYLDFGDAHLQIGGFIEDVSMIKRIH